MINKNLILLSNHKHSKFLGITFSNIFFSQKVIPREKQCSFNQVLSRVKHKLYIVI
jgi:hypothetical protein